MYTVVLTDKFKEDMEYYETKKKFKHIDKDIGEVIETIEKGILIGEEIPRIALK